MSRENFRDKEQGVILIVTGPPGAGKTTVATAVADLLPRSVHLVADTFWHFVRSGGLAPWLPQAQHQNEVVMEAVAASATEYAGGGYVVVVDGVVGPWFLAPFRRRAEGAADLLYVVLRPDEKTAVARASARHGPALVETQPVQHMYAQFAALGEYEDFVLDNTDLSLATTVEHVLQIIATGRHTLLDERAR